MKKLFKLFLATLCALSLFNLPAVNAEDEVVMSKLQEKLLKHLIKLN